MHFNAAEMTPLYYRDFLVWSDKRVENWDMKRQSESAIKNAGGDQQALRSIESSSMQTYLTFEGKIITYSFLI